MKYQTDVLMPKNTDTKNMFELYLCGNLGIMASSDIRNPRRIPYLRWIEPEPDVKVFDAKTMKLKRIDPPKIEIVELS